MDPYSLSHILVILDTNILYLIFYIEKGSIREASSQS